jgi:hypothetical protein
MRSVVHKIRVGADLHPALISVLFGEFFSSNCEEFEGTR